MIFEQDRWSLHYAFAWVLTRDRSYLDRVHPEDFEPRRSLSGWQSADYSDQAWDILYAHLEAGEIHAFDESGTVITPALLKGCSWRNWGRGATLVRGGDAVAERVDLLSVQVLNYFPEGSAPIAFGTEDLGPPQAPNGTGFMTFANAVYWIATEGGKKQFWGLEKTVWSTAIRVLIDAISSDAVKVIGRRSVSDLAVVIPGHALSGLPFIVPADAKSLDILMGSEPYLDVTLPSLDEDDWPSSTDIIYSGRDITYSHLQVSRSDVKQQWPFSGSISRIRANSDVKARASARAVREAVKTLLAKNPKATWDHLDEMAQAIKADRNMARSAFQEEQNRLGIIVRKGRPRKSV